MGVRFQIGIEKERCYSQLNRFSQFNFQKENGGIVIYNINQVVFEMKQSANQFSSDTQQFDKNRFKNRKGRVAQKHFIHDGESYQLMTINAIYSKHAGK